MARYQSRLESIIKTRKYCQERAQMELIIQERLLSQEKAVLQKLIETSGAARSHLKKQQKVITPSEIQLYHEFIQYQKKRIDDQKKKTETYADTCEIKRIALEKAMQDKKMIENIEAKQKEVYASTLKKKELLLLDEVAGQIKWRRR